MLKTDGEVVGSVVHGQRRPGNVDSKGNEFSE